MPVDRLKRGYNTSSLQWPLDVLISAMNLLGTAEQEGELWEPGEKLA